jgi:alcohol dehydrogenase class IV
MDMAKCVAVLLQHGGSLRDYYGENKIPGPVAPVIAVPTTPGTGSEVTPVAVIADTERGTKVGISSPYLIPRVAVCDPELTLTCPPGPDRRQRRRRADPCHRKLHRGPP